MPSVPAGVLESDFELIVRDWQARLRAVPSGVAPCRSRGAIPQFDDIASPHKRRGIKRRVITTRKGTQEQANCKQWID
uniref:Uncharacterized protein n=1 Tax=Tanacetum cinerariifolium TaxID=118510 RepID=A0A699XDF7_TANCI|nr:hypothetical protein [Tanacetum cinerariifolium]